MGQVLNRRDGINVEYILNEIFEVMFSLNLYMNAFYIFK